MLLICLVAIGVGSVVAGVRWRALQRRREEGQLVVSVPVRPGLFGARWVDGADLADATAP